jgi:hypothetical protein
VVVSVGQLLKAIYLEWVGVGCVVGLLFLLLLLLRLLFFRLLLVDMVCWLGSALK